MVRLTIWHKNIGGIMFFAEGRQLPHMQNGNEKSEGGA